MRPQNMRPRTREPIWSFSFVKRRVWVLLLAVAATACTHNDAYRTVEAVHCEQGCDPMTYIEQHRDYDLAFVEFSERGNVISRERMNQVLDFVGKQAKYDPARPDQGVLTVVYVHGWKHNARAEDTDVASFRDLLSDITDAVQAGCTPLRATRWLRLEGWSGSMSAGAGSRSIGGSRSPASRTGSVSRPRSRSPRAASPSSCCG